MLITAVTMVVSSGAVCDLAHERLVDLQAHQSEIFSR